ncbi:hypothetical protein M407DRAFT_244819, partial [Tulasnella calospora MUT 4182]
MTLTAGGHSCVHGSAVEVKDRTSDHGEGVVISGVWSPKHQPGLPNTLATYLLWSFTVHFLIDLSVANHGSRWQGRFYPIRNDKDRQWSIYGSNDAGKALASRCS